MRALQIIKQTGVLVLSLLLLAAFLPMGSLAEGTALRDKLDTADIVRQDESADYADYLAACAAAGQTVPADTEIALPAESAEERALCVLREGERVIDWTEGQETLSWRVTVEKAGFYQLYIDYVALGGNGGDIRRSLLLDGKTPCEEWSSFRLNRLYSDDGEPRRTTTDDEISPTLSEVFVRQRQAVCDLKGRYASPLKLYLTAGEHTLSLGYLKEDITLFGLTLAPPDEPKPYAGVKKTYAADDGGAKAIFFEAEAQTTVKTQSTLGMVADADPATYPHRDGYTTMNAIGGTYWNTGNDSITWRFTVKTAGLYKLSMRVYQNYLDGLPVHRQIALDGEVPFRELSAYAFKDEKSWRTETLGDSEGTPFLFYLPAGEHTLTMTVKVGEESNGILMQKLEDASDTLSDLILTIRMIIGNDPDTLYDYHLEDKIPQLTETLDGLIRTMEECTALTLTLNDKRPLLCNQFDQIASRLRKMRADPYRIPSNMKDLTTALSNFGTWIDGLGKQPLLLDFIEFLPSGQSPTERRAGLWQRLRAGAVDFYRSFTKDYSQVSGIAGETAANRTLSVWIGRGTTYARELKNLADSVFTPKNGIAVSLHTLPAGQLNSGSVNALMLALSSGAAPDVCLGVAADSPGEFAIRNALTDLTQFPDYAETAAAFEEAMLTPFTYQGGVYALPETLTFQVMLYRTDIFARLGLAVPRTWDEVYSRMLPLLSQNKLQFYMLCGTVCSTYETFLYQYGGTFYKEDYTASALDSPGAYQAMKAYCELFTVWGMPEAADLYNRMRTGEMPVGIGDYSVYLKLLTAAPELSGKWAIAPVPGRVCADGSVNGTVGGCVSESCMILSRCADKEAAWTFLKWWMSEDTQVRYARTIEGIYGESARWPSANLAAFSALNWERDDLAVIQKALSSAKAQPVVLGSYYTTRHVNNAWNRVVVSKSQSVRDSLEDTVRAIDKELTRRRQQYAVE